MRKTVRKISSHPEIAAGILIAGYFLLSALLFLLAGDRLQAAVQDNLDLFEAQYRMLKNTGTFFTGKAAAPFLGGISRDVLPSEWSLTSLLYFLLPSRIAYVSNRFAAALIGLFSMGLFLRDLLFAEVPKERGERRRAEGGAGKEEETMLRPLLSRRVPSPFEASNQSPFPWPWKPR